MRDVKKLYVLRTCLICGVLAILITACSSGSKDTAKAEKSKTQTQPIKLARQPIEVELESKPMADMQMLAKSSVYHTPQKRFRAVKSPEVNTEKYQRYSENGVQSVAQAPVSTFSIDVDTGSYTNVRRMPNQGILPPTDAIRTEEFVNYFSYDYPQTNEEDPSAPFSINTAIATSPWGKQKHIMRIGLKGFTPDVNTISGRNLVFLLDVSGSMNQPNKLPLLTRSLGLLTGQLKKQDKVSIVVYAGASGVVLETTSGDQKAKIKQALSSLAAGGGTNGQAGIELAYNLAEQGFIKGGVNRVILATDGDFNLGLTNHDRLIELVKRKRQKGIALTTLGFGQGNYNDHLMEQLADEGNGNYAYIDTIHEARKVLVDEMNSTLLTIAKDVKIQVEFNPEWVAEYRLLGYENRALKREDFKNDKVDAGEIGTGHTVTALYEVILKNSDQQYLDPLRYQRPEKQLAETQAPAFSDELAIVKLRYKPIDSEQSQQISKTVMASQITDFSQQSDDFRFASSVAGFAHLLKGSHYWQDMDYQQVIDLAQGAKGKDEFGYRAEFINLVRSYAALQLGLPNGEQQTLSSAELNPQGFTRSIATKATLLTAH